MQRECLFIHGRSSTIRHSPALAAMCQNLHVIEHDDIRDRLKGRMADLGLAPTGSWLKDYGIGQTTVRNFLDGMTRSLTIETVAKLSEPLKTSERWLLFGNQDAISERDLRDMAEAAAGEIQPGLSIAQIRSAVASALREQLALHLSAGASQSGPAEESVRDRGAQSPAPTRAVEPAGSHSS